MSAATYSEVTLTQTWKEIIHTNVQILRSDTSGKTLEMYLMMMEDEMLNATGFLLPWREWSARVLGDLFGEVSLSYDGEMKQGRITRLRAE